MLVLRGFHALPVGGEALRGRDGGDQFDLGDDGDGGSAIGALTHVVLKLDQPIKDCATTLLLMLVTQSTRPTPTIRSAMHETKTPVENA
jgi:hypothetical protein